MNTISFGATARRERSCAARAAGVTDEKRAGDRRIPPARCAHEIRSTSTRLRLLDLGAAACRSVLRQRAERRVGVRDLAVLSDHEHRAAGSTAGPRPASAYFVRHLALVSAIIANGKCASFAQLACEPRLSIDVGKRPRRRRRTASRTRRGTSSARPCIRASDRADRTPARRPCRAVTGQRHRNRLARSNRSRWR